MADALPELIRSFDDAGAPTVLAGETRVGSMAELMALLPALGSSATAAAIALNHFAQSGDFTVIEDPARFRDWFLARRAAEDPERQWEFGAPQVTDYDLPDLSAITAPAISGGQLMFYAVNRHLGMPYRVTVTLPSGTPVYDPLEGAE